MPCTASFHQLQYSIIAHNDIYSVARFNDCWNLALTILKLTACKAAIKPEDSTQSRDKLTHQSHIIDRIATKLPSLIRPLFFVNAPIVLRKFSLKISCVYRSTRHVFPTEESPIMTTFMSASNVSDAILLFAFLVY